MRFQTQIMLCRKHYCDLTEEQGAVEGERYLDIESPQCEALSDDDEPCQGIAWFIAHLLVEDPRYRARLAGTAKTEAKSAAARANGAKGGRPRYTHELIWTDLSGIHMRYRGKFTSYEAARAKQDELGMDALRSCTDDAQRNEAFGCFELGEIR